MCWMGGRKYLGTICTISSIFCKYRTVLKDKVYLKREREGKEVGKKWEKEGDVCGSCAVGYGQTCFGKPVSKYKRKTPRTQINTGKHR